MCCARPRDPPGSEPSRRDTSSHLLTAPGHHKPCLRGTKNEPSERRAEGILARSDFDRTHVRVDRETGSEQNDHVISTTRSTMSSRSLRSIRTKACVQSAHEENRRTIPHGDRNMILLQSFCFPIDYPAGASEDGAVRARYACRECESFSQSSLSFPGLAGKSRSTESLRPSVLRSIDPHLALLVMPLKACG